MNDRIANHPGKKLHARAQGLYEKVRINPNETPIASTKGVLSQGDTATRRKIGRKGYLLVTDRNIYWLALRGAWEVEGLHPMRTPQQFLGTQSIVYIFGSAFYTRRVRGVHVRRFVELNNLLAMSEGISGDDSDSRTTSAPPVQADVTQQITQLANLREQGHITPEEFERKKAELLDRI